MPAELNMSQEYRCTSTQASANRSANRSAMVSAMEAEAKIRALICPLSHQDPAKTIEEVPVSQALGRILAKPVSSSIDFPHWDNSAMDGYGVRYADVAHATPGKPVYLRVIAKIAAGGYCPHPLQRNEAVRIFTGSMLPPGADTIVPQEVVTRSDPNLEIPDPHLEIIEVQEAPNAIGAFVRYQGEYYQAGSPLLPAGIRLSATDLGVLAAAQCSHVPVYRPLRVGLLSTGNELVAPGTPPPLAPGQVVDSNQVALGSLLQSLGITPVFLGIVPDQPDRLEETIAQSLPELDVLISSGGVSVGDYDYVEQILETLGATLAVRSVAVKPGKPLTVAQFAVNQSGPLYFGLPGNPVSALVSFWRFVQPALERLCGWEHPPSDRQVTGYTTTDLQGDPHRETYVWGQMWWGKDPQAQTNPNPRSIAEGYWFTPASGSKSSGNIIHLSQVNALALVPLGQRSLGAGSPVALWRLG
jgi:molybdopterin molybdotransferase